MTIYKTPVPNEVIITSPLHFDHVFKMAEITDEPDGYLSDDHEDREVQFQTQKGKAAAKVEQNIEPSSTQNGKVHNPLR